MSTSDTKRPVHRISMRLVTASIWKNDTSVGPRYATTLDQVYQDASGTWLHTKSITRGNLLDAAEALRQAALWINAEYERLRSERSTTAEEGASSAAFDAALSDAASEMPF